MWEAEGVCFLFDRMQSHHQQYHTIQQKQFVHFLRDTHHKTVQVHKIAMVSFASAIHKSRRFEISN